MDDHATERSFDLLFCLYCYPWVYVQPDTGNVWLTGRGIECLNCTACHLSLQGLESGLRIVRKLPLTWEVVVSMGNLVFFTS